MKARVPVNERGMEDCPDRTLVCTRDPCMLSISRWSSGKEPTCQCRTDSRLGSVPGSGRSLGEGNSNPQQYSCLTNPMDRRAQGLQSMELLRVRHNRAPMHVSTLPQTRTHTQTHKQRHVNSSCIVCH